ncbi:acyl carrier protein [Chitinophaga solisilvae]|uniref:acyl carrier protein n=1 Tax=Chitinophaga solisilvae TaxID=1233460 RepID=UPI00136EB626|nr:acyl carrier protein [Chitinophaga solisilvae]
MKQPIESTLINAISHSAGIPANAINPAQSLDDLGMNSILAVQLLSQMQDQLGIKADLSGLSTSNTIGEIANYLESKA